MVYYRVHNPSRVPVLQWINSVHKPAISLHNALSSKLRSSKRSLSLRLSNQNLCTFLSPPLVPHVPFYIYVMFNMYFYSVNQWGVIYFKVPMKSINNLSFIITNKQGKRNKCTWSKHLFRVFPFLHVIFYFTAWGNTSLQEYLRCI
jgi:hypothetical protein